jgi:TRAP-type mannitol/chloroaromatic compound transport system permease small subunit
VSSGPDHKDPVAFACRLFAWSAIAATFFFLLNNYLTHWRGWPGAGTAWGNPSAYALLQAGFYALAVIGSFLYVARTRNTALRADSETIYGITNYIIRAAFWAVLLVGVADMIVSLLRVEGFLPGLVGDQMTTDLGRSVYRGIYLHAPLLVLGMIIAIFHRGLGFPWLALLVVIAELLIVFTRFIFSYEQAYMSDLVRFWYAALFLFASAYTLIEEGHVRVDVFYSTFSDRTKGLVNAYGSILLGVSVCVVVLVIGMGGPSTLINAPILIFETTPTGFGMYVKYWMAGFLGVFAVTMLIQFVGFFLEGVADYRGEPGKRDITPMGT